MCNPVLINPLPALNRRIYTVTYFTHTPVSAWNPSQNVLWDSDCHTARHKYDIKRKNKFAAYAASQIIFPYILLRICEDREMFHNKSAELHSDLFASTSRIKIFIPKEMLRGWGVGDIEPSSFWIGFMSECDMNEKWRAFPISEFNKTQLSSCWEQHLTVYA
jgi:hypothetical protein